MQMTRNIAAVAIGAYLAVMGCVLTVHLFLR